MIKTIYKHFITLFVLFMIILFPIHAEIMLGTGFISHTANIDESERIYFKTLNPNQDYNNFTSVNYIGPLIDVSYIPYTKVPLGVRLSTEILFPIGYNKTQKFRTFNADFKNRNMIGLTYAQSFSEKLGIFTEVGYEFDYYRVAKTNYQNNKETPEFNFFSNQCCYGEVGFLATIDHGYFKFGINYSHSIINKASSSDLIFAGGFKF